MVGGEDVPDLNDEPALPHIQPEENSRHGRLSVRPYPPVAAPERTGLRTLDGPGGELLALSYLPAPAGGAPYHLVLLLHGAGGSPRQALDLLLPLADEHQLLLLAPKSTASTWDLIIDGFGPDVRRIDRLLQQTVDRHPLDRIAIGGFSDGASYALTLGLANGALFRAILAFSPGFEVAPAREGTPHIFISHGTRDDVLPIDRTSRRLVPKLARGGYQVEYVEFDGGHAVPLAIAASAFAWFRA